MGLIPFGLARPFAWGRVLRLEDGLRAMDTAHWTKVSSGLSDASLGELHSLVSEVIAEGGHVEPDFIAQARIFEAELRRRDIPFEAVGG